MSRAGRPIPYAKKSTVAAGYAVYTMRYGGIVLGLFVIYHLLHFTFGVTGLGGAEFNQLDGQGNIDVYSNVVNGFGQWYVSLFYILAMFFLGLHLYHGLWSLFQTLGLNDGRFNRPLQAASVAAAAVIFFGNTSIPVSVLIGLLENKPG